MNVEVCDLCKSKETNKRFKIKMSRKGCYQRTGHGIRWTDLWQPYQKIAICEDCAKKLFGIKSSKTIMEEIIKIKRENPDCFEPMNSDKEFHYRCEGIRGVKCAKCKKNHDE